MTDSAAQPNHEPRSNSNRALLLKFVLPAGAAIVLLFWIVAKVAGPPIPPASVTAASVATPSLSSQTQPDELATLAAHNRAQVTQRADQLLALIQDFETELKIWTTDVQTLPNTATGKALATNPSYIAAFDAIISKERPGSSAAQRYRETVQNLTQSARATTTTPLSFYAPPERLLVELDTLTQSVQRDIADYHSDRESVQAMVVAAGKSGTASVETLESALQRHRERQALARAEIIRQHTEQAERKAAELEASARAEQIRREGEAKAEQIRQLGEQNAAKITAETEASNRQAERDRLLAEAKDLAVQKLFAPFLEKGLIRINIPNGPKTPYPQPVSFKDMRNVLSDAQTFAKCGAGSYYCKHNDRPRWPLPTTEAEWKEMERRRQLFVKLAPVWIELGLLNP